EVYNSLSHPTARKLYRYLGKQFWVEASGRPKRRTHRIGIHELCHDKLGYRMSEQRTSRLKEKISPALEELQARGVYGLRHEFDQHYGSCDVLFTHGERATAKKQRTEEPLVSRLIELRVRREDALTAVRKLAAERIEEDIEDSGFRERTGQLKGSRAGCLAAMLKSDEPWERPSGFVSSGERRRRDKQAAEARLKREQEEARRAEEAAREAGFEQQQFTEFLESLGGEAEQEAFARQALARKKFFRDAYQRSLKLGQPERASEYRESAMKQLWREGQESPPSAAPPGG
ncbi:MAG: hypothetical protein CMJ58_12390, partial [Planctomycetaceae bacterium]|nr:hypothetical protein [Planctomycetaceae bacterium]